MNTQKQINELTYEVIGCAIEVHKCLGTGLLESVYHQCLIEELKLKNINYLSELKLMIIPFGAFRSFIYVSNCAS